MLPEKYAKYEYVKAVLFGNQVQSESLLWYSASIVGDYLVERAGNELVLTSTDTVQQTIEDMLIAYKNNHETIPNDILTIICGIYAVDIAQKPFHVQVNPYIDTPKVTFSLVPMEESVQPDIVLSMEEIQAVAPTDMDIPVDYEKQAELLANDIIACISTATRENYPEDIYKTALLFSKKYYAMMEEL